MSESKLPPNNPAAIDRADGAAATDILLADQLLPDGVTYKTRGLPLALLVEVLIGLLTTGAVLRSGAGAPSNTIGNNGDVYFDQTDIAVWGPKALGVWPSPPTSLIGPAGPGVLSGTVPPANSLGMDGQYYIEVDGGSIYFYGPKAGGVWAAPITINSAVDAASALAAANEAEASATSAAASDADALTQAGIAAGAAGTATSQAAVAVAQAQIALAQAQAAQASSASAASAAAVAQAQVALATAQANLAIAAAAAAQAIITFTTNKIAVQHLALTPLPANVYANGAAGVGATITMGAAGIITVDNSAVLANDRMWYFGDATMVANGLYVCTTQGTSSVAAVFTRATDANTTKLTSQLFPGASFIFGMDKNFNISAYIDTTGAIQAAKIVVTNLVTTNFSPSNMTPANFNNQPVQALAPAGAAAGIFVPPGWGQFWKPKRNAAMAGNGVAHVAGVGDSIMQVLNASSIATSWMGLLTAALQGANGSVGDGGSGFVKTVNSILFSTGTGPYNCFFAGSSWTRYQPGSPIQAFGSGPGIAPYISTASGETVKFTVRGTSIKVYVACYGSESTPNQGCAIGITIDGVAQTAVDTSNAGAIASGAHVQVLSYTVAAGTHAVILTNNGNGANAPGSGGHAQLTVFGASGENATGVVVDNYAVSSMTSAAYSSLTDPLSGSVPSWNGGVNRPCDLLVIELTGGNDIAHGGVAATPAQYLLNIETILDEVKNGGNAALGNTDVLFVIPTIGENQGYQEYAQYCQQIYQLAAIYNAAVVNVWALLRNSNAYAISLNYFNTAIDHTHPSDTGSALIEGYVSQVILAA